MDERDESEDLAASTNSEIQSLPFLLLLIIELKKIRNCDKCCLKKPTPKCS